MGQGQGEGRVTCSSGGTSRSMGAKEKDTPPAMESGRVSARSKLASKLSKGGAWLGLGLGLGLELGLGLGLDLGWG